MDFPESSESLAFALLTIALSQAGGDPANCRARVEEILALYQIVLAAVRQRPECERLPEDTLH